MRNIIPTVCAILTLGCSPDTSENHLHEPESISNSSSQFDAAMSRLSDAFFFHRPEIATGYGERVSRPDALLLMDRSRSGYESRNAEIRSALLDLKAVESDELSDSKRQTYHTIVTLIEGALAPSEIVTYGSSFDQWGFYHLPYVINQNSGATVDIPDFLNSRQPVSSERDAREFIAKLSQASTALDGALEKFREDVASGAIPPDFVVEKSLAVVEEFSSAPADTNSIYTNFVRRLNHAGIDDSGHFADEALRIIKVEVLPAYERIGDYLTEIQASAPHDAGVWRLPNGDAFYAAMIRHMTDSSINAAEVHQTGRAEVERITAQLDSLLRSVGRTEGSVGERIQTMNNDLQFIYPNNEDGRSRIIEDVYSHIDRVSDVLPEFFSRMPPFPLEVKRVPEFSQESAPGAYYSDPAPDGSRPGVLWINLRDTALQPSFGLPSLAFHEGVPGHHLHGALSVGRNVPTLEKAIWSNSSAEGWALYCEQLAAEMGLYAEDPFGNIGRLKSELRRAVRLVVDTGIHAFRWTREESIDYMVATIGVDHERAVSEVERYSVWPGQALGYKIGMLKILELRDRAEDLLGESFDIRQFNDEVLSAASAPLPYIESSVDAWIRIQMND